MVRLALPSGFPRRGAGTFIIEQRDCEGVVAKKSAKKSVKKSTGEIAKKSSRQPAGKSTKKSTTKAVKKPARKQFPDPMDTYDRAEKAIRPHVEKGRLDHAIADCEKRLEKLPPSGYHKVLGRDWLRLAKKASEWIGEFYKKAAKKTSIKAIYCETNRFEINPDSWYIDAFAYDSVEGTDYFSWLSDWKMSSRKPFELTGRKDLQRLFERDYDDDPPDEILAPSELAILLLTLRVQELVHEATHRARESDLLPESIPVLSTAHGSGLIFVSAGAEGFHAQEPAPSKDDLPAPDSQLKRPLGRRKAFYEFDTGEGGRAGLPWDRVWLEEDIDDDVFWDEEIDNVHPLADVWKTQEVSLEKRKWRCDFYSMFPHWAVNRRAKDFLVAQIGDEIEFLPVKCKDISEDIYVLHPLAYVHLSPGSEYEKPKPGANVGCIRRYSFDRSELKGTHVFRVHCLPGTPAGDAGYTFDQIIVSSEMAKKLVDSGLRGIVLKVVPGYE